VPFGDTAKHVQAVENLIANPVARKKLGRGAQKRARDRFSAQAIVPQYEALYRRVSLANQGK
jgi:glycosyltransferase involved in cell wall biosynthesis